MARSREYGREKTKELGIMANLPREPRKYNLGSREQRGYFTTGARSMGPPLQSLNCVWSMYSFCFLWYVYVTHESGLCICSMQEGGAAQGFSFSCCMISMDVLVIHTDQDVAWLGDRQGLGHVLGSVCMASTSGGFVWSWCDYDWDRTRIILNIVSHVH